MVDYGEKCHCGHAMRSHRSTMGLIGGGLRHYSDCRYCDCKQYIPKSSKKSEWEYFNKTKKELAKLAAKEFRREVGREMRRQYKLQKEHWENGRRYYLRVLRVTYDILGIGVKEIRIIQSNPELWEETKIYLQGIVDWCAFLLTIQPKERQNRKNVEADILEFKIVEELLNIREKRRKNN